MFTTRTLNREWEIIKWMVILALAGALAMLAIQAAGGATPQEPARLPDGIVAAPLPAAPVDPNVKLWEVVALHRAGQPDQAIFAWREAQLPTETEVWRQIGLGLANLQLGELQLAGEHLGMAEDLEPRNPVVHYYLGLLRLDEARNAREWNDAIGPAIVRFAGYRPRQVVPNTKGMYELAAMAEFDQTIENAQRIDKAMVLAMPDHRVPMTLAPVTVNDLLIAFGCERFEGQAHHMLGAMYLDRAAPDAAEEHMDAAADAGLTIVYGYRDLGAMYERDDRHGDAARAYLKALENEPGKVTPLRKAIENFGKALWEM